MNENRSINDTRQNLESMLYGYYIKYTKMKELVDNAFDKTPNSNVIDIYVDVYDMLKPIYSKEIYSNKQYTIVSSVINLAAHLRNFFRKYYRMWTRIYLVYADDSTDNHRRFYNKFGDNSIKETMNYSRNNELILSQLELIKILAAYIQDVYFVRKSTMFPMFTYDNILKNKNIPAIIITKNTYAYQIPAFVKNTAVFRPKKNMTEDTSFSVCEYGLLYDYYSRISKLNTLEYLACISPQHLGLLMSLTGNSQFNLVCAINSSVAIRIIMEAISYFRILNSHVSDPDYIYNSIPELYKYMDLNTFKARYYACDLIYQHLLYSQMHESLDFTWAVNFKDPETVRYINDKYFVLNPLDLNSL